MANTAVKDVSSLFLNQAVPVAKTATGNNGDFHKVWNSQVNKGLSDGAAGDSNSQKQDKISEKKGDGLQEKASVDKDNGTQPEKVQPVNSSGENGQQEAVSEEGAATGTTAEQGPETCIPATGEMEDVPGEMQNILDAAEMPGQGKTELPEAKQDMPEQVSGVTQEQLLAMEILGTAAVRLMEQITHVFGVTMEELQSVMDSMEMEPADLLDASKLGSLLLELGGAKDAYALITDGALYDNYRIIMGQLNQVLQESADELTAEPEQLPALLKDSMQAVQGEEAPLDVPEEDRVVALKEGMAPVREGMVPVREGVAPEREDRIPVREEKDSGILNSGSAPDAVPEEQAAFPRRDTEGQERNGRQSEGKPDRDNQLNPFSQDFRVEQIRPGLQQTGEILRDSPWSADTRQIMDQILEYMKLNLNADTTSLEMQLHPASLGTLHVQIASRGGIVTANFITENEAVKAALENQMVQLREQFEEQGVKIEAIEVTVQTHEFEQNLEQGRGRSQQEGEKRSRGRRFRMGGVSAMSEMQTAGAEEADRMAADGSTVSYTA